MNIFSFTYIILSFQTLKLITALRVSIIIPKFIIPPHPLSNQNSHFIISPAMAKARRTNNKVIVKGKRRHFVIELKLKRKGKRKTSLYIYKFLSKKFLNYSFNFSFVKKFT